MPNHVLQLDCTFNDGDVERDLGSAYPALWVEVNWACDSTYLADFLGQAFSVGLIKAIESGLSNYQVVDINPATSVTNWTTDSFYPNIFTPTTPVVAMQFYRVKLHIVAGSPIVTTLYIDGVNTGLSVSSPINMTDIRLLDLFSSGIGSTGKVFFDDLIVGTTENGSDIYSDEFEGTLGGWNSNVSSSASIVVDPGIAPPAGGGGGIGGHGVLVAFEGAVLDASPVWTAIGDLAGVSVQRVEINRGRPTERDKTQTGTATITGVCTSGVLDPTYGAGTLFGKLDPMKQVMIELQNAVTLDWSTVFRGFVSDWNYEVAIDEKTYQFTIECEDALAIIADAEVVPDVAGNTVPGESTGDVYYSPVSSDDLRILAAIADTATTFNPYGADWPSGLLSIFTGNTELKGGLYSPRTSLLQVIDEAADGDLPWGSNRYVSKTGIITFHGRLTRFDPTNVTYGITFWPVGDHAAYIANSATTVIAGLKFTRGKTNLINAALVTPKDIKDTDIAGQFVSDATSIAKYGARSISFESLLTDGSSPGASWGPTTDLQETKLMATGLVTNYKDPLTRINEITFRPQTSGTLATNTWALLCGIELNDVLTVTTTHPGGGGFAAEDQFVEALRYSWDVEGGNNFTNVTLTAEVSPRANWNTNPFV